MAVMVSGYIAFALIVLVRMLAVFINKPLLKEATEMYFLCEAVGHVQGRCSRDPVEKYAINPFLAALFQVAFPLIPLHGLVTFINCSHLKKRLQQSRLHTSVTYFMHHFTNVQ